MKARANETFIYSLERTEASSGVNFLMTVTVMLSGPYALWVCKLTIIAETLERLICISLNRKISSKWEIRQGQSRLIKSRVQSEFTGGAFSLYQ